MEISRSEFMAFSCEQVHEFVLKKPLLRQEHADKLLKNEVDGSTLLRSSAKDVVDLYGLPGGPAKHLVDELEEIFPGEDLISITQTLCPKKHVGSKHFAACLHNKDLCF
jgi:hypothetical protein